MRDDGKLFPWLGDASHAVPNFLATDRLGEGALMSLEAYHSPEAEAIYRNFLDWLFETFKQDEQAFRESLVDRLSLRQGHRVIVTGCGLGEDLSIILDRIGPEGALFAQDLSPSMIAATRSNRHQSSQRASIHLSVGDAGALPFEDNVFDAAFHFGGFNLFDRPQVALAEMNRVVVDGGKIVVGDEGVAPWLRSTHYGKAAIVNNALWANEAPLSLLPESARDVRVTWILGNCFYLIEFTKSDCMPTMDIDVRHRGRRGGTVRSRYYGQLEGVTVETRGHVLRAAANAGLSVHDWLEGAIRAALRQDGQRS